MNNTKIIQTMAFALMLFCGKVLSAQIIDTVRINDPRFLFSIFPDSTYLCNTVHDNALFHQTPVHQIDKYTIH